LIDLAASYATTAEWRLQPDHRRFPIIDIERQVEDKACARRSSPWKRAVPELHCGWGWWREPVARPRATCQSSV